jgi:ATP-dependent Clp protease protease subunit
MSAYTIPSVIARDDRDDRVLEVYSHLLTERIISIGTAVDAGVANTLIAQLRFLESDNPDSDVQLSVNCDGGDPSAMLAVSDTMLFARPAVAITGVVRIRAENQHLLAEHSGQSIDHLRADTDHDRVISARQAQRYGLVDPVITQR